MPSTPKYVAGQGTTIANGSNVIGQVVNITPPKMERGEIDTSNLSSTWKEKMAAIPDGGDVDFTVEWDSTNTTHAALWTSFQAGTNDQWTVTFNDKVTTQGTTVEFEGFIKSFPWDDIDLEKVVTIKFTVTVSGPITITPAT